MSRIIGGLFKRIVRKYILKLRVSFGSDVKIIRAIYNPILDRSTSFLILYA